MSTETLPADAAAAADRVLDLLASRPPTLGTARLLCVDGPAGTGKTTLARAVRRAAPGSCRVVHLDDLYPGWDGLSSVEHLVPPVLAAVAGGGTARYRSWDWDADAPGPERTVPAADLLVLEGVGAGGRGWADVTTVTVWVDGPESDERRARVVARDGEAVRAPIAVWQEAEATHLAAEGTADRADLSWRT
ncbi:4-amino-4-deoxy-L-arabinose transferase [Nocardioides sp.]|uniref:4-amino-4-deoxy-L-arabinose transferase n=1 Tax=Nocardioides sp. TaxID=35761 RepID=UPI002732C080|nr:4-amino-4-deoxy-L-arabinose transferase [Nocardioides sp.]MDP3892753.1 4-amino-4-deoxy-L-arabinose transferase [Nocardioides sp.]